VPIPQRLQDRQFGKGWIEVAPKGGQHPRNAAPSQRVEHEGELLLLPQARSCFCEQFLQLVDEEHYARGCRAARMMCLRLRLCLTCKGAPNVVHGGLGTV